MANHVESYYAAHLSRHIIPDDIAAVNAVDIAVIGGGLAGLTAARELATAGLRVAVIECHRVGWGASGRNGGFVGPGFSEDLSVLERKLGFDHALELFRLTQDAASYIKRTIRDAGRDDVIKGSGLLKVFRHPISSRDLAAAADKALKYGVSSRAIEGDALAGFVRADVYNAGLLDTEAFHINPLEYAVLLAAQAQAAGASVHELTPATAIERSGTAWHVATPANTIRARHVILAGSAYLTGLNRALDRAILPVATYMITTEPLGGKLDAAISFRGGISDTRRAGDYYRVIDDSRLLWGGRITTRTSEPKELAALLKRDIQAIYPTLGDFRIEFAWSGLMGYCVHKMPLITRLDDGLWACTAFGGRGLATTTMGGRLIADAIASNSDQYKLFESFKPMWGGGPVGRVATQLIYWALRLQDAYDERYRRSAPRAGQV